MASMPGILTEWPWTALGSFKHVILAPWVVNSVYGFVAKDNKDLSTFLIFPFLLWRMLHNQLWITLSRYRTAKGKSRILDKGIEFDQVDRERNWDDQILFNGIIFYIAVMTMQGASHLPIWRMDGVILTALVHTGPVEFLYYWLHRALHHHYLYSRYHSHHHSSIVTEPITSVIHPFAEHIAYFILFAIPMLTTLYTGTASVLCLAGYITYIDFMNNMGHCNFELIPNSLFSLFPPLKYFMYTPSYHSLHHTQFRCNYSLFMPLYDYVYGSVDKSSDALYQKSAGKGEESPDVVHLTHLTTAESIYHLRLGFASLASRPHTSSNDNKWFLYWLMWPITFCTMLFTWIFAHNTFVVERQRFHLLTSQTWALPKYTFQYFLQGQRKSINGLIEEAILEADKRGVKVLSLGLLNQGEELNRNGEVYLQRHPDIKTKLVDGSSLAVAIVLNSIPKGSTQVLLRGSLTKVAYAVAFALCHKGIQVTTTENEDYEKLKRSIDAKHQSNVVLSKSYTQKTWLVGDGLSERELKKAIKGTIFIPFSQFPPKKMRKDCFYYNPPAMEAPQTFENVDSCENWLPRRVMSASRVAGIVHALEKWDEHECGYTMSHIDKVWQATLKHGFKPLIVSTTESYP